MPQGQPPSGRKRRRVPPWVTGLLLLAAVVLVVARLGEAERIFSLVARLRALPLLLAFGSQALTYPCLAVIWWAALARAGQRAPPGPLLSLSLMKLFADQALPMGGVSGSLLAYRGLGRYGVDAGTRLSAMVLSTVGYWMAHIASLVSVVAILWAHREHGPAVRGLAIGLSLVTGGAVLLVWRLSRGPTRLGAWLLRRKRVANLLASLPRPSRKVVGSPWLLFFAFVVQGTVLVLNAVTMWVLLWGIGQPTDFALVYVSVAMAVITALLSVLPGGLGAFEATSIAMLKLSGVPLAAGLTATLLMRGFTLWLPMIPGLWLTQRAIGREEGREAEQEQG